MNKTFKKQIGHGYLTHAEAYLDIDTRYSNKNYFLRLSLSCLMFVIWLGRCNWFKGRGVEVVFEIYGFDLGFGVSKPYWGRSLFYKDWSGSLIEPYHNLILMFWWFGIQFSIPKFIQKWLSDRRAREIEKMFEDYPESCGPNPDDEGYETEDGQEVW